MLYLLDANVLIDANRDYYPMDRVPEFWAWLQHVGAAGQAKIPLEVYEELQPGDKKYPLSVWAHDDSTREALLLKEQVLPEHVQRVVEEGYAPNLTDVEVETLGCDPFLIAHALTDAEGRCVVSTEVSKPSKLRANRKVPDVCDYFEIERYNVFEFIRKLNFRTDWK